MRSALKPSLRRALVWGIELVAGSGPRFHRVPFGPYRGKRIYISPELSPMMFLGINEPWMAQLARDYIRKGDVVYDIGAHIGYTAVLFRDAVGNNGAVHAFEILPSTVKEFLMNTVLYNGFENIVIHNVGLGANARMVELPVLDRMMTSIYSKKIKGRKRELCRIETLDQYVAEKCLPCPRFIKVDVERAEMEVLSGGKGVIMKYRPIMVVEFHSSDLLREGYGLLQSMEYTLVTRGGEVLDAMNLDDGWKSRQSILCLP